MFPSTFKEEKSANYSQKLFKYSFFGRWVQNKTEVQNTREV